MDSEACENIGETLRVILGHPSLRRTVPEGFRRAGVLVPLAPHGAECDLILTKRTLDVETHKGQISFPGGVVDAADADIRATALRETNEELGIPTASIELIGLLDDLTTPTGFVITPVVGLLNPSLDFHPNSREVAEVFRLPLAFFADEKNGRCEVRLLDGKRHEVWFYNDGCHEIWGATAAIIRSLLRKLDCL
jgi:8-oxo-dGTP pyrophosphatase MutT (NUDIX family)